MGSEGYSLCRPLASVFPKSGKQGQVTATGDSWVIRTTALALASILHNVGETPLQTLG